jgi:hypothetical protein
MIITYKNKQGYRGTIWILEQRLSDWSDFCSVTNYGKKVGAQKKDESYVI